MPRKYKSDEWYESEQVTLDGSTVNIGNVTVAGGSLSLVGNITVSNLARTLTGNVTLDVGSLVGIRGNITLSDSKGFVGLVTIGGTLEENSYLRYASLSTVLVKSGAGVLHTLSVNTKGTGTALKIYDSLTPSGTLIATIDTTLTTTAFVYDVKFTTGLTLDNATGAAAGDITVSYR